MAKTKSSTKTKTEDLYYCDRCNIDSTGKQMCPCPRGSCDAEVIGEIKTTVEVIIHKKVDEPPVVPFGDVEEMRCPTCDAVTGHHVVNKLWTCIHCGTKRK